MKIKPAFFRDASVNVKLTLLSMITTASVLFFAFVFIISINTYMEWRHIERDIATEADIVGLNIRSALLFKDADYVGKMLKSLERDDTLHMAAVYSDSDIIFSSYVKNEAKKKEIPIKPGKAGTRYENGFIITFSDIEMDNLKIGKIYLKHDMGLLLDKVKSFAALMVVAFLLSSIAAFLLWSRLQKIFTGPLSMLSYSIDMVSGNQNYSYRVDETGLGKDEMGTLIKGFNHMLEQIETRDAKLGKYSKELEGQVEDRTIELKEANNKLASELKERKKAAGELKKSLSLLHATIESTEDGLLVVDREGKVGEHNRKFVEMWRIPEAILDSGMDKVLIQHVLDQLDSPEKFLEKVQELYSKPDMESFDVLEFIDGRTFERYSRPQWVDGESMGRVWSFRDITKRIKAEKDLKEAKELADAANRTKSQFLANMSHELRTPLNAIIGFSDVMLSGMAGEFTEIQEDFISDINSSGNLLLSLISDILDVSKIEAGKMELNYTPVKMDVLIDKSLIFFKEQAFGKLTIDFTVDKKLGTFQADDMRIKQVLVNLVGNAVKFTPEGGEILISARLADEKKKGKHIHISIADTGIGITKEECEMVFNLFHQSENQGDTIHQGSGLGLALSKKIIELHSGKIWVESEIGKGSTFHFTLPYLQG